VLRRRFRIIVTFFGVWLAAIVAELGYLTLLGNNTGFRVHGVPAAFVFGIGISYQIIFQGPTRSELLESCVLRQPGNHLGSIFST
jgi:hypothetical protein